MKTDISIIIPVYNRESCIKNTLESLTKQTEQHFEIIIVDDGSTDASAEIVKEYTNLNLKYIYQENSGVSVARNRGMIEANGNFICFLDSDDFYESTFLEKMYNYITMKDSDVCYCGYNKVTLSSKEKYKTTFVEGNILEEYILGRVKIPTASWMIRKEIIDKNGLIFNKSSSWGEDIEFFCGILSKTKKVCSVKEYLTNITIDNFDNNKLSSFSIEKIDKDFNFINRLLSKGEIKNNKIIKKGLIDYRLSALITYRLLDAFDNNIDKKIILEYFNKYRKYIVKFTFNNGLRSLKLNINKIFLLIKLMRIRRF